MLVLCAEKIRHFCRRLFERFLNRKKYAKYADMPDFFVAFFAASGFVVSGFYGFVLSKVVPGYLDEAIKTPIENWGYKGWILTSFLAALGLIVWHFGSISWRCSGILRERWYK